MHQPQAKLGGKIGIFDVRDRTQRNFQKAESSCPKLNPIRVYVEEANGSSNSAWPTSQQALTHGDLALKLLSGLSTGEISARLFLTEANVQKLLERGRTKLAELWAEAASDEYLSPTHASLERRRQSVLDMLHVLFTAGHSSLSDETGMRLCCCTSFGRSSSLRRS